MIFLEDENIRLRAVEPEDASSLLDIENDTAQWIENGMSAPYSFKNLREYAAGYDADPIRSGQLRLIIASKADGKIAGIVDLYDISATSRTAFIGIYVCSNHRQTGTAAAALKLLEVYSRQLLNLRVLGVKIAASNEVSKQLFSNAGYTYGGRLGGWLLSGRTETDLLFFYKNLE